MRYWDIDRNRSLVHAGAVAGGRHVATDDGGKARLGRPVTSGKLVDLSFDLVRSMVKQPDVRLVRQVQVN